MAKNKKKLVDLKPEKITDEQLKNLQDVISNINKVNMEIGRVEAQKHRLLHDSVSIEQQLQVIQKELEKQYGTVNININDGIINYPSDEQVDKKN